MKKITLVIAAAMAALFLASCSQSGRVVYEKQTNKLPSNGESWTVLVYMCASQAESEDGVYTDKLKQMMSVDYPENITVAVQTGGSDDWHMKGIYGDYTQRFEVGKDTLYLADQSINSDMGNYRTLMDFIAWGLENYHSDKYMLILSGVGGNCMDGMGYDAMNDDNSLNLEEISYAMSFSGRKFDVVGLDSSLMGSLETATALSTYADYLVASQDVQSENDWDYAGLLQYMCDNPSSGEEKICQNICDTYYDRCRANKTADWAAMSVTDMSKVSTLNQAFDNMAGDMLTATDSLQNLSQLMTMLDAVHIYGGATECEGYSDLMDLGDIALKTQSYVGESADMLIEALNDAIVYRICGEREKSSTGLSVYYPLDKNNDRLQLYMELATSAKYKEFLRKVCVECNVSDPLGSEDYTSSWAWNTYNEDMQSLEYDTILDMNSYDLNVRGNMDLFKDISINVYRAHRDGVYVFAGNYDRLDSDIEAGIFKDGFDGMLMRLCGKIVSPELIRSNDEYELYSIPVMLNGERSNIRVERDKATNKYKIIFAWAGCEENGKVKELRKRFGFFNRISPILSVYDEAHTKSDQKIGAVAFKFASGVADKKIKNGSYLLEYELTDIYGLKRRGTAVKATASAGKLNFR